MGSKASLMLQKPEIEEIHKETGFSHHQIMRLYSRFLSLDKTNTGFLSREDFLRIPELAINPLGDRIIHAFFSVESDQDQVNFRQFMRVLARFRPVKRNDDANAINSRDEKLKFAFRLYDLDGDDRISREEILAVLHMMVGDNITEAQLNSIAERTLAEADEDKDGFVTFDDFKNIMYRFDAEEKMSIKFVS